MHQPTVMYNYYGGNTFLTPKEDNLSIMDKLIRLNATTVEGVLISKLS